MFGGVGCVLAAAFAERLSARFGVGPIIVHGLILTALGWQAFGLVSGPAVVRDAGARLRDAGVRFRRDRSTAINYLSLRQAITPDRLLGRMTATMRFLTVAAAPLGSLAGGALATVIGLRATLLDGRRAGARAGGGGGALVAGAAASQAAGGGERLTAPGDAGVSRARPEARLALAFAAAALLAGCDAASSVAARAGFGGSFEERCERKLPATRIDVVATPAAYDTDRSRSYLELTRMSGDAGPGQLALGLTTAQIGHTARLETAGIEDTRTGRVCVRPAIRVELTMTPMTVYVGREMAGDPCREAAILEHEMKHVAVYARHLDDVSDAARKDLVLAYGNTVHYFRDRTEAQRQSEAELAERLGELLSRSAQRVKELQAGGRFPGGVRPRHRFLRRNAGCKLRDGGAAPPTLGSRASVGRSPAAA